MEKKNSLEQKNESQSPKNRTNSTKEFSQQFEGATQQNKGLEANRTRKFTQKFGKIFVAQVLWGTFSVPEKKRPRDWEKEAPHHPA